MKTSILDAIGARHVVNAFKRRRAVTHVVEIAVGLIIFATLGVAALTLLFSATTTNWGNSVPTIAITVTAILASLAVALSFFGSGRHGGL